LRSSIINPGKGSARRLHYDPISTAFRKVTFFLHDQGIPFESRTLDVLKGEQFAPDFLALNPSGAVPVLEDDDFVLIESGTSCPCARRRSA
jgi:glutathione S-transferase